MKKINLCIPVFNEYDQKVGEVPMILAGSFMRFGTDEEHVIFKMDVFIEKLKSSKPFELDEADFILFRNIVLKCDAAQVVKSIVLKVLNKEK